MNINKTFRRAMLLIPISVMLLTSAWQCGEDDPEPRAAKIQTAACGEQLEVDPTLNSPIIEAGDYQLRYYQGNLRITHLNWTVPCDWHDVQVSVSTTDSTIVISECCDGGQANCLCTIENTFLVLNHTPGTYEFIFQECGTEVHRGTYTI